MLNKIIIKQTSEVRKKTRLYDRGVVIPANLRRADIKTEVVEAIKSEEDSLEKALYFAVDVEKPKQKSISDLLLNGGR